MSLNKVSGSGFPGWKMNRIKIKIIVLCSVLMSMMPLVPAYPGESGTEGHDKLLVTPVLIRSDVSSRFLDDVSAAIRKNLQSDDFFIINDKYPRDDSVTFNNYITGRCVTELAKVITDGIIILVAVKKGEVKIGEKQHSRYVVEDIIETRYTIYVSTVDLLAGRYDLRFRETVNDAEKLAVEADHIGKKIREFYIRRKPGPGTDKNTGATGDAPGAAEIIQAIHGAGLSCVDSMTYMDHAKF